jgi:ABC-type Fe3+/spermidine/putrescine transport system ATPase subunit
MIVECRGVTVDLGSTRAVDSVDLDVAPGETVALLGPSGSGKSTLLYAVAGLVDLTAGSITLDGRVCSTPGWSLPPELRTVGFVFQHYALWPHLDAVETVSYPLRRAGRTKRDAAAEARRLLELLGVGNLANRRPSEMSGGQQQRVGMARALARSASLYLFDEPTAHLDPPARAGMQEEISRRREATSAAAIYATHDAAEAMAVADRLAILRSGAIVQVGRPQDVYERPVDLWSARLTGPASVVNVAVSEHVDGHARVVAPGIDLWVESPPWTGPAMLVIRPDWVCSGGPVEGIVREVWYRGAHTDYRVATPLGDIEVRMAGPARYGIGEKTGWNIQRGWPLAPVT